MKIKKINVIIFCLTLILSSCKGEVDVILFEALKKKFNQASSDTNTSNLVRTYYFSEATMALGNEPWITDTTPTGTRLLKDIAQAHLSSYPRDYFKFGNKTLFTARNNEIDPGDPTSSDGIPVNGRELWITDSTEAGTFLLKDINPGPSGSDPNGFTLLGDKVIFTANNSDYVRELWITDGTPAGTQIISNDVEVDGLDWSIVLNGKLYFVGSDSDNGYELWSTDGTAAGTTLVKDLYVGSGPSDPLHFYRAGNQFYFFAKDTSNKYQLWITDGTSAGTTQLTTYAGANSLQIIEAVVLPNNKLVYSNYDTSYLGINIFVSDGTPAGSMPLTSMISNFNNPKLTLLGDKVIFKNKTPAHGIEPWATDGTVPGTILLKDINPGTASAVNLSDFKAFDGAIYFTAQEGADYRVFKSDGTFLGTNSFSTIVGGSWIAYLNIGETEDGGLLFFRNGYAWNLYKNTSALVKIEKTHELIVDPDFYVDYRNHFGDKSAWSFINMNTNILELWVSDGTEAGTIKLAEFDSPPAE